MGDYFRQAQTYRYVVDNLMLRTDYHLPGVFLINPHKGIVNGSLWTLPHEEGAYLALLGLFVVSVFRLRVLALGVFVLLLANPLLSDQLLFAWRTLQFEVNLLVPCFAMDAVLALYKERISIGLGAVVGLFLLWLLFRLSRYSFYLFYTALFSGILYLSGTRTLLRLKPRSELSYGVYLWGFPVQQTLVWLMPQQGTLFNQAASLAVVLLLGFVSWHLVGKRGIALGQQVIGRLARRQGRLPEVEPERRQ